MKKNRRIIFIISICILLVFVTTVSAIDNGIESEKTIHFLNNSVSLELDSVSEAVDDDDLVLIYNDDDENQYFFRNNDLVGYINNSASSQLNIMSTNSLSLSESDIQLNLENYKSTVLSLVSDFIDSNATCLDDYELYNYEYLEATEEYSYTFLKKIAGYWTNDGIIVSVDHNGNLKTFASSFLGLFDNYNNIVIDESDLNDFIEDEMDSVLDSDFQYYVDSEFLNFIDNKLVLQILITIVYPNGTMSTQTLAYEL